MINRSICRVVALLLLIAAFPVTSPPAIAQTTNASIGGLAVNPVTNRVYAELDNSVVVIDGTSNSVIATLSTPNVGAVAVNPATNRIYVLREGSAGGSLISVIDGATNTILTTVQVAGGPVGGPHGLAVNPTTNRVYVAHSTSSGGGALLSTIDGATNAVISTLSIPNFSAGVQVNPNTNRIYISIGHTGSMVGVVDGATNKLITVISLASFFSPPPNVVVNPTTNRIYAGGQVIDGATNTVVASIPVDPLAVNTTTNRIYGMPAGATSGLAVVDGATNTVQATVPLTFLPVIGAVNPTTNRIYAVGSSSRTISVINGSSNTVVSTISLPAPPPPAPPPAATFFFAEGSTQPPFDTWFLVQNPTDRPAVVQFTFEIHGRQVITRSFSVGPTSRFSLFANQILPNVAFSTRIDANQAVLVERSMFVGFDGDVVTGIPSPNRTWLFAEGSTQNPFQTWLLLQNPNNTPTTATITYLLLGGGTPRTQVLSLPPLSRTSVFVNQVLPNAAFSTRVDSSTPIIVERAMYRFPGNAATADAGVNSPSRTWFIPEGNTTRSPIPFDTFLLLQNPNSSPTTATITLFQPNGTSISFTQRLAPTSRQSVFLNQVLPNTTFGIRVDAADPIIAERSIFVGTEPRGALATPGATNPATTWFLAEGSTQPPFNEVIYILNPNASAMSAHIDFDVPGGQVVGRDFTILPTRTLTISVNDIVVDSPVSARVTTSLPSVVERTMFFRKLGSLGGHDTIGIRG